MESNRLLFRKYTMEDIDFFAALSGNPAVMRYIGAGVPWTRDQAEERLAGFIRRYDNDEGIGLMLALRKSDDAPIGHAGLIPQVIEDRAETEVGYWIAQDFWGQGYATEAAAAWRDFGFDQLEKKRLVSIIQFENGGSIRVAEHIGMAFEREVVYKDKRVALYSQQR